MLSGAFIYRRRKLLQGTINNFEPNLLEYNLEFPVGILYHAYRMESAIVMENRRSDQLIKAFQITQKRVSTLVGSAFYYYSLCALISILVYKNCEIFRNGFTILYQESRNEIAL